MKWFTLSVYLFFTILSIIACDSSKSSKGISKPPKDRPGSGAPGAAQEGEYYYDHLSDRCTNGSDKYGYNQDKIGECGKISSMSLTGQNYSNHNFNGAIIEDVDFRDSKFDNALFLGSVINDVNFSDASMVNANFEKASISQLDIPMNFDSEDQLKTLFVNANLKGANLEASSLNANFNSADLRNASIANRFSYFINADLRGTVFKSPDYYLYHILSKLNKDSFMDAKFNNLTRFTDRITVTDAIEKYKMSYDTNEYLRIDNDRFSYHKYLHLDDGGMIDDYYYNKFVYHKSGDTKMDDNQARQTAEDLLVLFDLKDQSIDENDWLYKTTGAKNFEQVLDFFFNRIRYIGYKEMYKSDNVAGYNDSNIENGLNYLYRNIKNGWKVDELFKKSSKKINDNEILFTPFNGQMVLTKTGMSLDQNVFQRISTYLHEAHHSSCSVFPESGDSSDSEFCSHGHVECPKGHEAAGEPACDNHPWGAYSVGVGFNRFIANKCTHELCDDDIKTTARMIEKGYLNRILILDEINAGKYDHLEVFNQLTLDDIEAKIPGFKELFEKLDK